ncbi:MAG: carboxypeptidase-like regulatory domain-containing protein [Bacteroidota bacterium]|nr:carboxypeptidase-like regulatory domain-containing protein [Bacteroidota bacterium]
MKRTFYSLILLATLALMLAIPSSARQIAGQVVDPDGNPVAGAQIFVDMTTLQTTSDENGRFDMDAPLHYAFEVVAVAPGYAATGVSTDQEDCRSMTVTMMQATEVVGAPLDEDMMDFFSIAAFSYTRFARDIEIDSPDALRYTFDESNNAIRVEADGPFVFTNLALGYKVTIHEFRSGGNAVLFGWDGYTLFEPMTPEKKKDEKNWAKHREESWEGSRRHFLSALMSGEMKEQEWAAWFVAGPGAAEDHSPVLEADLKSIYGDPVPILYEDDRLGVGRIDWAGWLRIQYFGDGGDSRWPEFIDRYWPVSDMSEVLASEMHVTFVELPTYQAFVDDSGVILPSEQPATRQLGYWTFFRLADMLPLDWKPE